MAQRAPGFAILIAIALLASAGSGGPVLAAPLSPVDSTGAPAIIDGTHVPQLQSFTERALRDMPQHPLEAQPVRSLSDPATGTLQSFWSWDFDRSAFYQVPAVLQRVGPNTELWVESGRTLPGATLDSILATYDSHILPRERQAFGSEPNPGIDGSQRVTILLLEIRDGQYYGHGGGLVGGYFWSVNEYTQADLDAWYGGAYKSNQREMIFVDATALTPGSVESNQVIAHENEHLIHWLHDGDEDGWINEGFADLGMQVSGLGMAGSHTQAFLDCPGNNLLAGGEDVLADYGAYGLFALYLWDNYGGDATLRQMTAEPQNGIAGLQAGLAGRGYTTPFADIFSAWTLANYIDDPALAGYTSLDIVATNADGVMRFRRPPVARSHTTLPVAPSTVSVTGWAATYVSLAAADRGSLALTLSAGAQSLTVNVVTSLSATFAPGTNTRRVIAVPAGATVDLLLPGLGSSFSNVLLAPARPGADTGAFAYQARLVTGATATPSHTPTSAPSATSSPTKTAAPSATSTATPTGSATPAPSPTRTAEPPTASATATSTGTATTSPTITLPATRTATAAPTGTSSATPTATVTAVPPATATMTLAPSATASRTATPTATASPAPVAYYAQRVNSGGRVYVDSSGNRWLGDVSTTTTSAVSEGGNTYSTLSAITGTEDDVLYQNERWGMQGYRFAVPNGVYQVTLKFAEIYHNAPGRRIFDVKIQGRTVLSGLDLYAASGGKNRAYDRTFEAAVNDGQLVVSFVPRVGDVKINAIAVVSAGSTPPTATPSARATSSAGGQTVRVNLGGSALSDSQGNRWSADQAYRAGSFGYAGGATYATAAAIGGTEDDTLYQSERWGLNRYVVDLPDGLYNVTLYFAELYYWQPDQRIFDVTLQGQTVLSQLDVFAAAGGRYRAYQRTFTADVAGGHLTIDFTPVKGEPKLNALSITPAGP